MSKISRGLIVVCVIFLVVMFKPPAFAARPDVRERLKELGATQCPNSAFTCLTVTVPLDHFNPLDTRTLDVVFAILPATGTRKGMYVTVTGGPGTSGIYYADSYTSYFDPRLRETFDLVFLDQRGVALSGGLTCPKASAEWYTADWRADTEKRKQALKTHAQTFTANCDAELNHPDILPYLGTTQAVEDLEIFRALIGDDKFWLYGESYGTQYAQTYAYAHGEHLAGMILDGTVDLTPDGVTYYARAVQSFNNTLVDTLRACSADAACANDFGKKPLRVYDKLKNLLEKRRAPVMFPLGDGTRAKRALRFHGLDTIGIGQMYGEGGRMMFARALAAYARDGDLVPLMRLLYPNLGVNENTLEPSPTAAWSDAYFYAVECQDYGFYQGAGDARANEYIDAALPVEQSGARLSSLIWGDLPCVFWRASSQDPTRPPHWTAAGIPTFVLNAAIDPITPLGSARAVYEHLDDGYLIVQRGGPHVIYGRGVACVDDTVNAFLLHDVRPAQREMECNGRVMSKYIPLAPRDARSFKTLLAAFESAETEINYLPEFWYWDYAMTTRTGCPVSGTLKFQAVENRVEFTLKDCAFSNGFVMTGTGMYQSGRDRFVLKVNVTGYQNCALVYERKRNDSSVTGDCEQVAVSERGVRDMTELEKVNARELLQMNKSRGLGRIKFAATKTRNVPAHVGGR